MSESPQRNIPLIATDQQRFDAIHAADEIARRLRAAVTERLAAAGSPAVRDGRQAPRRPGLRAEDLAVHNWPGFHSASVPTDVLH